MISNRNEENDELCHNHSSIVPRPYLGFFTIDLVRLKIICWVNRCIIVDADQYSGIFCDVQRKQDHAGNALLAEVFSRNLSNCLQDCNSRLKCCIFDKSWHTEVISRLDKQASFELSVLDNALFAIAGKFNRHLNVVKPIYKILHEETLRKPSDKVLRRILALKKSLLFFSSNVKSVSDTIYKNFDISGLNLSAKEDDVEHKEAVGLIIKGYHCDLQEIQLAIQSMLVQIEETKEYISMQINEARNKIIRMSLNLEISMLGLTFGACVGSLFGMNLNSGLEENPNAFLTVAIFIISVSTLIVGFLIWRCTSIMSLEYQSHQFTILKNFFKYIDLIDALKMRKDKSDRSKASFGEQLMRVINKEISPEDADLIYLILGDDDCENGNKQDIENAIKSYSSKPSSN